MYKSHLVNILRLRQHTAQTDFIPSPDTAHYISNTKLLTGGNNTYTFVIYKDDNYRRHSNYASFLILRQNATFQTGNFQWCVTLWELIFYCCVTRISWLQMWTVIVTCHRWCVKLRHIRDMTETWLVVRDGIDIWQRQPQQQSHVRFQCLGSFEDTTYIKEYGRLVGEKPTTVRVPGNDPLPTKLCNRNTQRNNVPFLSGTPTLHTSINYTTSLVSRYRKRSILWELVEVVCNTHFRLSLLATTWDVINSYCLIYMTVVISYTLGLQLTLGFISKVLLIYVTSFLCSCSFCLSSCSSQFFFAMIGDHESVLVIYLCMIRNNLARS